MTIEDDMSIHVNGHEFGWTPGVDDGQGGLACCNSWGHKESDTTERLNWPGLNIYFCFIDYAKAFDCVGHNKLWKILKEMGIPDHFTCLLRNLYAGQEATGRTRHEQQTGSKLGKKYIKAVYCHPAYLTYKQSTSWKMPDWMKLKLKSRLLEKYQ